MKPTLACRTGLANLFWRMALASVGSALRSLDMSRGCMAWGVGRGKGGSLQQPVHVRSSIGTHSCKDGPQCQLCLLFIHTQSEISNDQLHARGGELIN